MQTKINFTKTNLPTITKSIFAVGATALQFLFGGWSVSLQCLVALVILDYIVGVVAAFKRKELDSEVGHRGIAKKIGFFVLVAVAHLVDKGTGTAPALQSLAIYFLVANEGISIIENLGDLGVPLPDGLKEALYQLRGSKKRK